MKIRGILAVVVLGAASLVAQDTSKSADHAACKRDKSEKMDSKKECCCKKNKDGQMKGSMDSGKTEKPAESTKDAPQKN
jgi:putative methionine-R-sulfoxide reductase with GAF domain